MKQEKEPANKLTGFYGKLLDGANRLFSVL